jgi:hypothetical protein
LINCLILSCCIQNMNLSKLFSLIRFNKIFFYACVIIILWGSYLNFSGKKFSKAYIRKQDGIDVIPKPFQYCKKHLMVELSSPNLYICCDSSRESDLLCIGAYDTAVKVLSSYWAFYLPYLPLLCTFLMEIIHFFLPFVHSSPTSTNNAISEYNNPLLLLLEETARGKFFAILLRAFQRGFIYFIILYFRVVSVLIAFFNFCPYFRKYVLYLFPFNVVEYLIGSGWMNLPMKCWCPHLVSERK